MKLHVDNDTLRRQIAADGDNEPTVIGTARYEVSAFNEAKNAREVIGYRDDPEEARKLADTAEGRWPWVTDTVNREGTEK